MLRALGNVASRHLLDRRLNPLPELRDAALGSDAVPFGVQAVASSLQRSRCQL